MQESFLIHTLAPIIMASIMFGMGLSLTKEDFLRLWKIPKPAFIGLFCQLILLPIIGYFIVTVFELNDAMAIGLMILSACPGGAVSNVISHFCRLNLALSVTLTAISSVVCVFTTPLVVYFAITHLTDAQMAQFSLSGTIAKLFFITLLPISSGIAVRHFYPEKAARTEEFFRRVSMTFILLIVVGALIQERALILSAFSQVFIAAISMNLLAIATGFLFGFIFNLGRRDGVTLGVEVGMQNVSMALLIGITFLNEPAYSISPGVYGLTSFFGAGLLIWLSKRLKPKAAAKAHS